MLLRAVLLMLAGDVVRCDVEFAQTHLPTTVSVDRVVETMGTNIGGSSR